MKLGNGTAVVRTGAGPAEGGDTSLISGLECRVGKAPLAIPVESIAQIIEYQTVPLPLARRWIAGIGLHEGRLVLTIGLVGGERPEAQNPEPRLTTGILLRLPRTDILWALEVREVMLFVRATSIERSRPANSEELPAWIMRATTTEGRSLGWIDVPAMVADLTTAEGEAR
jgi:chemotaxis signal transduction protein